MNNNLLKTLVLILVYVISISATYAQTTKTVGGSGADYSTLQLAFAAINNGAIQGQIILQITGSTTETALTQLNASGSGSANYTSVLIYPTGAFTISTALNSAAIDLNGADNVTIDGRLNGNGTPNSLTITGTNTGNGAAAIRFVNSAENNTIKYCNLRAGSTSSSMGIVAFAGSNTGNGNDNNIVEYCDLTNSGTRPYNGIVSSGTTGRENSGNIIRNNNIYNNFQTGTSSNVININFASVGFTISGNSIYETTAFISTTNALTYNAIRISTTTEHTISGNYIGGREPLCGGTAWSFVAQRAVYFCGIYAYAGAGTATIISNNTIANLDFSSKEDNPWDGIFLYAGNFEVSGNTIGATTGNGSIICRTPVPLATTTLSGGTVTAINLFDGGSDYSETPPTITFTNPPAGGTAPTATATVSGGVVTGFTISDGGSGYTTTPAVIFDGQSNNYSTSHGMIQNSTGIVNITGNNIGSITTVGSNHYSHGFEAIYVRTILTTTTLTNNLIGSLTTENSIHVSSAAASSLIKQDVYGIYSAGTGTTTILGNTVANLTNAYAGTNGQTRTRGIQTTNGINILTNNTVFNVKSASLQTGSGAAASVIGISQTSTNGTMQTVTGNTVYNLSNTSGTLAVQLYGMYYAGPSSGTNSVSGNFVHSLSASSNNIGATLNGIVINSGLVTCANNIINLGGTSFGYLINGIWDGTSSGNNVSIYFNTVYIGGSVSDGVTSNTAGLWNANNNSTRDYRNNIFCNARTGGTTGIHYAIRVAGTTGLTIGYNDYVGTLSGITLNVAPDNNSLATNPGFASAGGTSAINYYPSATLTGVSGTGITTDYYGITRVIPKMGALEQNQNVWLGTTSTDFNTTTNWANNAVPASGTDIFFATSPTNECVLDADRIVGNITNGSSKNLMVNGHTLTVNGNLIFTSNGKINTSTASSVVKFAGAESQTIPTAAFESNSVAGLETANSNGVLLNGNLTVSSELTLTSGTLTMGANTLTISGNSIGRTSGNIDASNSSAVIVFENSSAITLPASVFTGEIQQLTLNTSSGITAGSDLAIKGNLHLIAANPSANKGLLDMATYTLELKIDATITGQGDVTGIVRRAHAFTTNIPYAFGSHFTTITFIDDAIRPAWINLKISIGTVPGWSPWSPNGKVARYYNIAIDNNSSTSAAVVNMRYLLSELDGTYNDESKLVFWHKYSGNSGIPNEYGKSNQNFTDHYLGVTGIVLSLVTTTNLVDSEVAMAYSLTDKITWKGGVSGSETKWEVAGNWLAGNVPLFSDDVLIPGGLTYYPSLTASSNATAKSIEIESGASITANDYDITITGFQGAWINDGIFYPGTGKVTFNHGIPAEIVTISGTTNFYDIEAGANTMMQPVAGNILRIAGAGTAYPTSIIDFSTIENTVEWNGADQTIVNPSGLDGHSGFYNLIISGSGTKTMPSTAMTIRGNLSIDGTASATAGNSLNIDGNLLIGSSATLGTGIYSHQIKGNIICNGAIAPDAGSMITMNGSSSQTIQGDAATISLGGLTISNSGGVTLHNHATTAALGISTGTFTVTAGKSVSALGATTLGSAQCLVLKSDENGTASFIDNGTISGSGTARIERYLTPYDEVPDRKFHFISSPVGNAQAIENEFIDLASPEITDFYKWDEPGNIWINFRSDVYDIRNEDFGDDFKFVAGKGYLVAYPAAVTKNFVGAPYTNASGLTVNCTNTSDGGFNLAGNPFPSSINWNSLTKSDVDATLYYYDNSVPAYKYYNTNSGGIGGATENISPMQGFMVHASAASGSVGIANGARTHSGLEVFYKNEPLTTNILDLKVEGNDKTDYARVCFYDPATENFDGDYDAFKIFSYSPTTSELYSKTTNNILLAINTLPLEIMNGGSVPLLLKVGLPGNYSLTAERINSFAPNTYITLEDKFTGTLQKLNDNPVYEFSASSQDSADRFVLHFKDATSIAEPASQQTITAWYNNGQLTIDTPEGTTTVDIFNIQGQNLRSFHLHGSGLQQVSIILPTGVYFARMINNSRMQTVKMVIQ